MLLTLRAHGTVGPARVGKYLHHPAWAASVVCVSCGEAFTRACAQISPRPRDADMDVPEGLGLTLMRNFASQLGGHLALLSDGGTTVQLTLPPDGPGQVIEGVSAETMR